MSVLLALDIGLAALVLAVAVWTIAAREAFAAVVGYVAYGLLLSIVWVRLFAVDVALTEAAIGSGVTGVLLIGAAARLREAESAAADEQPSARLRLVAGAFCVIVAAALAAVVLLLPDPAATLAPEAAQNLAETGLGNPITAVLMAYRSFDTMLEKVVLVLAVVGVWSLAPDRYWGGAPGVPRAARPERTLAFLAQLLPPLGILVGVHIVWVGADEPGGAFQGGAILAAMCMIAMMARLTEAPPIGGGFLLVLVIVLPVAGVLLSLVLGGRHAESIALGVMPAGFAAAIAIAVLLWRSGKPLVYILGGFAPPLGIALRADGFSAVMLVTAAIVISAAGFFARANFGMPQGVTEARAPLAFWTLLQALWAALNIIFLGGDLFNLYVALELLTFAAVPLVCLDGRPETLAAALRYLLFALSGSALYLLGAALLYGAYGTLDIVLLAAQVRAEPAVWVAAGLMTAGLLAKTALFPLHLWLPPAHANAPAAASAVLSALVVKASFFLIVRLWFDVLPALPHEMASAILAALGSAAIVFGSVLALRQERLKLLIAYSTVAQIGYLFLMFPLAIGAHPWAADAWSGGLMQLLAHAFAKAAMFLAAGLIAESLGHDRIADLGGIGRAMPMTVFAFGLGGLSLMGLPPSGGFAAKWLLLMASVEAGQLFWAAVMLAGGLLAGGYVYRVLAPALASGGTPLKVPAQRSREAIALALFATLLGFAPPAFFELLQIGRAAAIGGPQ